MKALEVLLAACLLAGGHAQRDPRPTATPSQTDDPPEPSPTGPKTHIINVGADGYSVQPNVTRAKVGDTIEWKFHSGEHWIIRGTIDHPCIPREYYLPDSERLSSGPVKVDADEKPNFRAKLNNTDPLLFYSGADGACVDHLMMGVINPNNVLNLVNYKKNGRDAKFQLRPGDPWPEDEDPPSTTNSHIPTATETGAQATTTSPADNDDDDQSESDDQGLSTGAIAGLAVGGAAALVIFGLAIFYCGRRGGVKILFTNETPRADSHERFRDQGQYPRYVPPVAAEAPFRPPRPPSTENWRPTMDQQGNFMPRTLSPEASLYQHTPPATSPYKGHGASGYLSAGVTPPARHEQRQIASYYDPHLGMPGWTDVAHSRMSSPAVELPTSSDPGNSPLPRYQAVGQGTGEVRKFSWSGTGEDALFRTSRA